MRFFTFLFSIVICHSVYAQTNKLTTADKSALEGVIIEKYYISDSSDYYSDTSFWEGRRLEPGSVTYRIYIDLKPEYNLQMVYGSQKHELCIQTTTSFYNVSYCGALIGYNVYFKKLNEGNYCLDSWVTINSATNMYAGIPLSEDKDSSVLTKKSLVKADGFTMGNLPQIRTFNMDFHCFYGNSKDSIFSNKNGGWAAMSGIKAGSKGPTSDNKILVAQLTTTGKLSFELNIQVGTPSGGVINFVAKNPEREEVQFEGLSYSQDTPIENIHK